MLIARKRCYFCGRVGRAVGKQAMQQKNIEKAHGRCRDAYRHKWIEIHQPHFNIFDTAFAQRVQRTLALKDHALGANGAVKLILNLQQRGGQLVVIATWVLHTNGLVRSIGPRECVLQRCAVTLQRVVAHRERCLRVALIAKPTHAQRGAVRHVHRVLS